MIITIAKVIVEVGAKNVDKTFNYLVPSTIENKIEVGKRVKVPFGHQYLEGFVISLLTSSDEYDYELKEITALIDEEPILNEEMLNLGKIISEKTLCSKISAYQAMLPKALKASHKTSINIKKDKYISLAKDKSFIKNYLTICKYPKQIDILKSLLNNTKIKITRQDSTIKTLLKHNLIKIEEIEKYRYSYNNKSKDKIVTLNEEQQQVVDSVSQSFGISKTFLLYGITGAGKTEVYMNIIKRVVDNNKTAIMLVPEISLTPQIVERFSSRFGDIIAILHSGLSSAEAYDEYRKIIAGNVKIVIGARSAIFAPLKNIGIIIIDEEHTSTYKQDNHPRYDAKDVAIMRSKYHNCPVLLGSATPSLESMARACNKVYTLLTLTKRAGAGHLPKVSIIDMKEEIKKGNFIISRLLDEKIKEKLQKNEQILLLLNRRGYSSILTCNNCGETAKCPNCDISLTYHKTSNMLRCHYCGYATPKYTKCPSCGNTDLKEFGLGTEKLEEELNKKYSAKIVRMDIDTTSKKGAHQKIIDDFANHKYDILVGTQMIAKGLDFPLVTLVGVLNADASLNIPDYRSSERTFQLISQVAGRAGRAEHKGEVIIQTYNNNHYSIVLASQHNYPAFYLKEMKLRKKLNYSPYYYIILVTISTKDYNLSFTEAKKVGDFLKNNLSSQTFVLGPAMANIFRINNIYKQQCIIKYKQDPKLKETLLKLDNHYKQNSKVNVEIDINPNHL